MDYDSADEYDTDTLIKEDISDIIFSHASIEETKILAEGAPGIGKTMLLKKIARHWATGDLFYTCRSMKQQTILCLTA